MGLQSRKNREKVEQAITSLSYHCGDDHYCGTRITYHRDIPRVAIWANESWGRYWAWDPKESWALITILVYAFIVHMRFMPGLKSLYPFNLAAVLGLFKCDHDLLRGKLLPVRYAFICQR